MKTSQSHCVSVQQPIDKEQRHKAQHDMGKPLSRRIRSAEVEHAGIISAHFWNLQSKTDRHPETGRPPAICFSAA
jgi:hypothetical protein